MSKQSGLSSAVGTLVVVLVGVLSLQVPGSARAAAEFLESHLDGVWVGTIQAKSDSGTRSYPLLLNLDADASSIRGLALVADDLLGSPSAMTFVALASGAQKGKKIELTMGGNSAHRLVLRLKKGVLKGKLLSGTAGLKTSKVELRPIDATAPLQQVWVGDTGKSARGTGELVALAITQGKTLAGAGFIGSRFGSLRNLTLAGSRLTATMESESGDIDLDLDLSGGMLSGSARGAGVDADLEMRAGGTPAKLPSIKKIRANPPPAGKSTEIVLAGKNLADGFLIHVDHPDVYITVPVVKSAKSASARIVVPEGVVAGTELTLQLLTASGATVQPTKTLVTATATAVSFRDDLRPLFASTCALSGCHAQPDLSDPAYSEGETAAGDLVLGNGAYGNLVNRPSSERPELFRVEPGNPDRSYLIMKLRGAAGIDGERMPFGGPFLAPDVIDMFVRWIEAGAELN